MYLFIFETIGTQELVLIAIVALIFLGPRRMPDMAKKLGKMMADFRNATSEFKTTWEKEVNFEQEEHALRTIEILEEPKSIAHTDIKPPLINETELSIPEIKEIDPSAFELRTEPEQIDDAASKSLDDDLLAQKQSWL